MYLTIKLAHILLATLSGTFFLIRGWWMLGDSNFLQKKWVKISPHVIDSLLLLCAVYLAIASQQYPFQQHWLTVKVVALVAYIGLGIVALKRGKTKAQRAIAFVAALFTFAFMFSVARTHNPFGFFSLLIS